MQMELTKEEVRIIENFRAQLTDLKKDYEERLLMYHEGLTHAGDVIQRRAFLIQCGETVPEIIFNGYKCPK